MAKAARGKAVQTAATASAVRCKCGIEILLFFRMPGSRRKSDSAKSMNGQSEKRTEPRRTDGPEDARKLRGSTRKPECASCVFSTTRMVDFRTSRNHSDLPAFGDRSEKEFSLENEKRHHRRASRFSHDARRTASPRANRTAARDQRPERKPPACRSAHGFSRRPLRAARARSHAHTPRAPNAPSTCLKACGP